MSINFFPNDPDATVVPMRVVTPRANRPAARAGYTFIGALPEAKYDPVTQPAGFVFWQAREAAIAALEAWEQVTGTSFTSWQPGKKIELRPDEGLDANAFYDRVSLSFFHFTAGANTFFSGASTDVVAHEAGHGILDAIRPDLILSSQLEVNAFHEAFGDVVAILTALHDKAVRTQVLADVGKKNFVEGTAENLSRCIKAAIDNGIFGNGARNAAAPRRARNTFQWQLPSTLPDIGGPGDGPGKLINESHSFGQLFSGCFYDVVLNVFKKLGGTTEAQLLQAAQTAGRILAKAVAAAPIQARFFRAVGRAMIKVDETDNGAANRDQIKTAFEAHNIPLGTGAMFAPVAALAGAAPTFKGSLASLTSSVKKDLMARIGGAGKVAVSALRLGGDVISQVVHQRPVSCSGIDKRLKGVFALAQETVLVGDSGGRAAVLGALPDPDGSVDEVETFVRSLVKKGAIDFGGKIKKKSAVAAAVVDEWPVTHRVKTVGSRKTLVRFRYACRCGWTE